LTRTASPNPPGQVSVLEVRRCTKEFPGVIANQSIDFTLQAGEILAVLGENGAGKSTLTHIVSGLYKPTRGEIVVKGRRLQATSPRDAIAAGIGMVHQHFQLIPTMTVLENIILGQETVKAGRLDLSRARREILRLTRQSNWDIDPGQQVGELPVGTRQKVEIVKALYRKAEILLLDEPTSVLTPQEIAGLFEVLRQLAAQGIGIIFVTHKPREALAVAHRVLVLRQGRVTGNVRPRNTSEAKLAALMAGRTVPLTVGKDVVVDPGPPVLTLEHVDVMGASERLAVRDLSFTVHAGEIVGLAGMQGHGQTELVEAIAGLRHPHGGRIGLAGRDIARASPRQIARRGSCGHVPEDRHACGMIEKFNVAENLVLTLYHQAPYSRFAMLRPRQIKRRALELVQEFDIRTASIEQAGGSLSGGNQQKMVVARECGRDPRLLLVAQPTRGVDAESLAFIHAQIVQLRNRGAAVLLASYDIDEIIGLADRVAVMFEGRLIGLLPSAQADRNRLGLWMAGIPA